jgi:hypothetical protein
MPNGVYDMPNGVYDIIHLDDIHPVLRRSIVAARVAARTRPPEPEPPSPPPAPVPDPADAAQLLLPTADDWRKPPEPSFPPTIEGIKHMVCWRYGLTMAELTGQQRQVHLVRPRHIACYLCCRHTGKSLPIIGRHIGDRDHSTIVLARKKIAQQRKEDPDLDAELAELERMMGVG